MSESVFIFPSWWAFRFFLLNNPIQVFPLGEDKQLSLVKSRNQWIKIYLLYSSTYKWACLINFWSLKILSIKGLKSYMIKLLLDNLLWMLEYFFRKCLLLFFKNHLCSWRSFIFLQGWTTRRVEIWLAFGSGHRTGKGQFSFQSQRKAMPKNAQTAAQLQSSHMLVK